MKIVKCGRVFDLDYSKYEAVAKLPSGWTSNAVGNLSDVSRELRKDLESGEFYIAATVSGYGRESVSVTPVGKAEAMKLAEDLVDYDQYVKFFGDPEGNDAGLRRERDKALEDKKSAEASKDYWYREYVEANRKAGELEAKLAEIQAKLDDLAASKGAEPCL